jgi:hypothetical protein
MFEGEEISEIENRIEDSAETRLEHESEDNNSHSLGRSWKSHQEPK